MAKPSKGFKQLLKTEQHRQDSQATSQALAQRFQRSELGRKTEVVVDPEGQLKMSDVLEDFVAPFLSGIDTLEQRRGLFTIAVIGWNLALFPAEQRDAERDQIVAMMASENPNSQFADETRDILDDFIAHKLRDFAQINRYILDFELKQDRRGNFFLSVMSTPEPPASSL